MAKAIATITGTALVPGVSRNGRWYKPEHVREAVRTARERLAHGEQPMVMLTFHGADDNSREIAASLTDMSLNENGGADFAAAFTDTEAGWDIARLADNTDGRPAHLKNVSIRGAWTGKVRKERGPGGQLVETADGVELDGVDFTRKPGVPGAEIKTFAWVKDDATETAETTERVLITESVQEAHVTAITEETTPAQDAGPALPGGVLDAFRAVFATDPALAEAGTPAMSKRGSGLSGGGRVYADPGYQKDKRQRYDITDKAHAVTAWRYINQKAKAAKYTGPQLKQIKSRIVAALKKFGVQAASEGWILEPAFQVSEAVAEMMGDPSCAGSYSLSATNGPTTVTVCSYGLDPADLAVILQRACAGAGAALCALDPDMDGDIDVEGADAEDDDGDAGDMDADAMVRRLLSAVRGESAEALEDVIAEARDTWTGKTGVAETSPEDPAATQDAADQETEAPVTETTTTQEAAGSATAAPSLTHADVAAVVAEALAADRAARKAKKAKGGKKAPAAETAPAAAVAETAPAALTAEAVQKMIADGIKAGVTEQVQALAASGAGPSRKGLVAEHSAARAAATDGPGDLPMRDGELIPMEQWSEPQRRAVGAALQTYVLGDRAEY